MNSEERKTLIYKRFVPIIDQILTWPDKSYSDNQLFYHVLVLLSNNKDEMINQIDTIQIINNYDFTNYYEIKKDIEDNYDEYMSLLKICIKSVIESKYPKFIRFIDDIEKYQILMN